MRRYLPGLRCESLPSEPLEGIFLVRIEDARYQYHPRRPLLCLKLMVLAPEPSAGRHISARLECSSKQLWKLRWFLNDFGYSAELIGRDLVESKTLLGLSGVVRVSQVMVKGSPDSNLEAFAPATSWHSDSLVFNHKIA